MGCAVGRLPAHGKDFDMYNLGVRSRIGTIPGARLNFSLSYGILTPYATERMAVPMTHISRRLAGGLAAALLLAALGGCGGVPAPDSSAPSVPPATTTTTAAPTTTTPVPPEREEVAALLTEGRVATVYRATWNSIFGRLQENGFLQESLTGRYKGEYVRSVGAFAILAVEAGETAAAGRALRFVTDTVRQKILPYLPFTIAADGTVRQEDELDGRAHFVLGWAQYIAAAGEDGFYGETYDLMKREADAFCSDTYFNRELSLMRNRRLTHSRMRNGTDYPDAYDLLTNSFVLAALEELAAVAERRGQAADTARWRETAAALRTGLRQQLTHTADGNPVFWELRYQNGGRYTPEQGVSWICLTPFADRIDAAIWENTVAYTRQRLWQTAPTGGYLAVECAADGTVKNRILGKSVGWDLAAAARQEDYAHALESLRFLEKYHTSDIYMEWMTPAGSSWKLVDCGNGEQAIWFLWGVGRLRQSVGLAAHP